MERDAYERLSTWKGAATRKPLLLRGARQTGKTFLLRAFGRERYAASHYFNFEQTPDLASLFQRDLHPERIVRDLSIFAGARILPERSLIVFDEIQACNAALNSLKYFAEDAPQYHVAAAGSLLGVVLSTPHSFPVGKVDFVDLHPMTFLEFLDALGEGRYRGVIEEHDVLAPFPEAFHHALLDLLRAYYFVGGMPEAVVRYAADRDVAAVRAVQQAILDAYVLDFAKHAPAREVPRIMAVWESLPRHLARENRKFIFSAIQPSARARDYEDAIVWLEGAGLILRAFGVETARLPLRGYADRRSFKVYALDVGPARGARGRSAAVAGPRRPPVLGVPRGAGRELRCAATGRRGAGRTPLLAQLGGQGGSGLPAGAGRGGPAAGSEGRREPAQQEPALLRRPVRPAAAASEHPLEPQARRPGAERPAVRPPQRAPLHRPPPVVPGAVPPVNPTLTTRPTDRRRCNKGPLHHASSERHLSVSLAGGHGAAVVNLLARGDNEATR